MNSSPPSPTTSQPTTTPTQNAFGNHLRLLRRQSRLTQAELGIAVGYSPGQISMLESGQRTPDPTVVTAVFTSALGLAANDPQAQTLIALAHAAHPASPQNHTQPIARITKTIERRVTWERQELGVLEDIPPLPAQLALREHELNRLRQTLTQERRAALVGLPGMGKTTLAACLAHAHAQSHPVFWMTISPGINQTQDDVLRQLALFVIAHGQDLIFASALARNLDQATTQAAIPISQLLDSLCANLGELDTPLLVFDDAHHLQDDPALHTALNRLHALARNCQFVFTSRQILSGLGAESVPQLVLSGLPEAEARTWLNQLHPNLNTWQIEQLLSRTQSNPLLLRLAAHANPHEDNHAIIDSVLRALSPSAQHALSFLSIVRTEVNLLDPHLARLLQEHNARYVHADAVRDLQRHMLIEQPSQASAHTLIREPVRNALRLRHLDWAACHKAAAQWAAHLGDGITAAHHWQHAGERSRACDALADPGKNLPMLSRLMEAVTVIDDLIHEGKHETQHAGQPHTSLLCRLHTLRGDLLVNTLRANEAHASFTEALALAAKPLERARIAEKLAHYLHNVGRFEEALNMCDQALAMLGKNVMPEAIQLRLQLNTPRIKALVGLARFDEARAVCEDLLNTANKMALLLPKPAQHIRAQTHLALGYVARIVWRSDASIHHLREAARHAQQAGLADVEANALILLSTVLRDLGQMPEAKFRAEQALTVAEASGNSVMVATVLHAASVLSYFQDEHPQAMLQSARAVSVRHKLGDVEGMLACRLLQAVSLLSLNQLPQASALVTQVMRDVPALQNPWLRGYAEYICGIVVLFQTERANHISEAQAHFARALVIPAFCADPDISASAQLFVAWAHLAQGDGVRADEVLARTALPPGHVQPQLLHDLTAAMTALVKGQHKRATSLTQALVQRANQAGYFVYAHEAARLMQAATLSIACADLPRFITCGISSRN
jgi:ATP/maltotriose-dependent transcriptional regulator MalT/DNA-binding XRE family transcriptional regulator